MKARFEKIPYADGMSFACLTYSGRECRNPLHVHPEFELIHFVRGRGQWIVGDAMGEMHDGFIVLLAANLPHMFQPDASRPSPLAHALQFREDCLGAGFWELPENRAIRGVLVRAHRGLAFSGPEARRLRQSLTRLLAAKPEARLPLFLDTLGIAAAAAGATSTSLQHNKGTRLLASVDYQSTLQPDEAARINKVLDYANARLGEEIYLGEVAKIAGLSEAAFSRFFARTAKKPFSKFLNELRISHACRKLVDTDATITEVAFASGFGNLSNFNRRFLELRGETPGAFRQRRLTMAGNEADNLEQSRFASRP